ncbi:MAG: TM2 domain-containing protein [Bdellovibrionota bacterium]
MSESTTWPFTQEDKPTSFTLLARLTIFFSWIGIHRFYAGKYYTGTLLIVLFFTVNTISAQLPQGDNSLHPSLMLMQIITIAIQMHDLFKVSFGFFKDAQGNPVVLTTSQSVQSDLQLGPLLVWASLFGIFGAHNFYAKKYQYAFLQLITLGGLGVWTIYEIFQITKGDFKDAKGLKVAHIYSKDPHIDIA